jgi:Uncharacterized conserved protein
MKINKRIIDDITSFIFVRDDAQIADIIFIPGGSHPEMGEHAADLYKRGFAKKVMPSGGVSIKTGKFGGVKSRRELYSGDYATDCEFLADVLRVNGVPDCDILREDTSGYTKENAFFSRKIADENGLDVKTAIICCKNYHARRSLMCYQLAFPETEFYVCPVPYILRLPRPVHRKRRLRDRGQLAHIRDRNRTRSGRSLPVRQSIQRRAAQRHFNIKQTQRRR